MHQTPSIAKYISVSDTYFDYVTGREGVVYYKIAVDGVLVGGLHCEADGGRMYLSICVREGSRRRGIAEAALRRFLFTLPEEVKTIEVSIDETNVGSRRLFQKLGFTEFSKDEALLTYRLSTHCASARRPPPFRYRQSKRNRPAGS